MQPKPICPERRKCREKAAQGLPVEMWQHSFSLWLKGWKFSDCFVSNVYLPNPRKLPEEKKRFVINSFVNSWVFLQKSSDGNFLGTCIFGLTCPLFAEAGVTGVIYFVLWCIVQFPLKATMVVSKLWEQLFDASQDFINEWEQPKVSGTAWWSFSRN